MLASYVGWFTSFAALAVNGQRFAELQDDKEEHFEPKGLMVFGIQSGIDAKIEFRKIQQAPGRDYTQPIRCRFTATNFRESTRMFLATDFHRLTRMSCL